jgi:hypothetical protein
MTSDLDDVLRRVAAGELSPDDALALLDPPAQVPTEGAGGAPTGVPAARFYGFDPGPRRVATSAVDDLYADLSADLSDDLRDDLQGMSDDLRDDGVAWPPPDPATGVAAGSPAAGAPVVQLRTSYRRIHVVADPAVAELFVTGAHSLRRDGTAFVIENPGDPSGEPDPESSSFNAKYRFTAVPFGLARPAAWKDERLVVRVNPMAFVDVEMAGGHLGLSGLWGGVRLRVAATAVRFGNVRGPVDIDALTSSVKGMFGPTGSSRVDLEQSSFKVQLLPGSNLRIQSRNRMGKVILPTTVSKGGLAEGTVSESTLGSGQDRLVIDALMSSVSVSA